ncbi:unnamed protein product [Brassica napus]|uniref:(rape) hypothetical protein n=1 Tax=Brassica napus TaxID=3708 RepID=A0A816XU77_BRANA|nr:unnamed protein product [Brassica napus]
MAGANQTCIFCQILHDPNSTTRLLHTDEKVVAFQDIKPAARRHYLVIPKEHIPTVRDLQRRDEDYSLAVSHMLSVGQELLQKDAPQTIHRFGFHQPPFNSVDHLHLHCFALPFMPRYTNILHTLLSHALKLQKYDFLFLSHIVIKTDGKSSSTCLWDLSVVLLKHRNFWRR